MGIRIMVTITSMICVDFSRFVVFGLFKPRSVKREDRVLFGEPRRCFPISAEPCIVPGVPACDDVLDGAEYEEAAIRQGCGSKVGVPQESRPYP